jgi:hypothetical protein
MLERVGKNVLLKVQIACENRDIDLLDHFIHAVKMVALNFIPPHLLPIITLLAILCLS